MKTRSRWYWVLSVLVLLLVACVIGSPTVTPQAEVTPVGGQEPAPSPGTYYSPESGVRLRYPDGWDNQEDPDGNALTMFLSPDGYLQPTSGRPWFLIVENRLD